MSSIIQYNNVSIHQAEQIVLKDINLQIGEGEFVYLLGRVGSGKSSFMKTMYGELPIAAGEAHILDYDLAKLKRKQIPYLRRKLGVVFQDFQLLTDRNVYKNLCFVLKSTGWKDKQEIDKRIREVLHDVEMDDKAEKMPHELSGGEQQRICIARAILNHPKMIVADEPTANLDPETADNILELLREISQKGTAVIMTTHNMPLLDKYPGFVYRCDDGKVGIVDNLIYG